MLGNIGSIFTKNGNYIFAQSRLSVFYERKARPLGYCHNLNNDSYYNLHLRVCIGFGIFSVKFL